jgi:hypothetical protein
MAPNDPGFAGNVVPVPVVLLASTGEGCNPKRNAAPTTNVTAAKNRMVREDSLIKVQDIVISPSSKKLNEKLVA